MHWKFTAPGDGNVLQKSLLMTEIPTKFYHTAIHSIAS